MGDLVTQFPRALADPAFYGLFLQVSILHLVPFSVQWVLFRRMGKERREQGWNGLTWACAILWLSNLMVPPAVSMIPFAWVTRPESGARAAALALLWGVLLTAVTLAIEVVLLSILEALGVKLV